MPQFTVNEICGLAARLKSGETEVFNELYEATAGPQYFTALSILKNPDLAEDAVQTVYMQVYKNISRLVSTDHFMPWLSRITYNTCINILKLINKSGGKLDEEMLDSRPSPDVDINPLPLLIKQENQTFLVKCMSSLPPEHRAILIMKYYQELKLKEIAEIMGISEGTVKSRVHYALKKLKKNLKKQGYHGPEAFREVLPLPAYAAERTAFQTSKPRIPDSGQVRDSLRIVSVSALACITFLDIAHRFPAEKMIPERDIQVSKIDQAPPALSGTVRKGDAIHVTFTDESGIDFSSLEAKVDGKPAKVLKSGKDTVAIYCKEGTSASLTISDKSGNRAEYLIKTSVRVSGR